MTLEHAIDDLVAANRILATFDVVDAYGHVSMRHPDRADRFLLSRSRSPELVEQADITEIGLDGEPLGGHGAAPYLERFIHAGVYRARPDVGAVVHSHARDVLPFTIARQPLLPVVNSAANMGTHVPLWDIRERFGDETNTMVTTIDQGLDLARGLGTNAVVLMRGHGFTAAAPTLYQVVRLAVYLPLNAQVLTTALRFGEPIPLSPGEVAALVALDPEAPAAQRAWEFWCTKAGVPYRKP